jgi:chromate transporter
MARLREIAALFTKLGFTAFGGPAAHIALMEEEVVNRRRWLDRQHFLDMVSAVNFVPGPNSTELAIHLGLVRGGHRGLVLAGACFILPAMLIILPIAWAYVEFGRTPRVEQALLGIKACMVAIVAIALLRFAKTGIKDVFTGVVAAGALAAGIVLPRLGVPQTEIIILAVAAVGGMVWYGRQNIQHSASNIQHPNREEGRTPVLMMPVVGAAGVMASPMMKMSLFFLKVGATLFGSGYVLASFLRSGLVEQHGWLSDRELLDAIAVGQITPGPLLTTATFIGYVLGAQKFGGGAAGGLLGGALATFAIFLPSFLFIAVLGPMLNRLRQNPRARGALDGMNAAVVSLIAVVTFWLARTSLFANGQLNWLALAVFAGSLAALGFTKINATWVILAAGLAGVINSVLSTSP